LVSEEELKAERIEIHGEELCNLYFSPSVISEIVKRMTSWQEIQYPVKWSSTMEKRRPDETFNFIATLEI
jgi:hypothetical protein